MIEDIFYDHTNKYFYIYHIVFNTHGYIGSTKNPRQRILNHLSNLKKGTHDNIILQNAFYKYKEENFKVSILYKGLLENRNIVEEYFINNSSYDSSYNILNNCNTPLLKYKNNKKLSKEQIINIFKDVDRGMSLVNVSKKYNISKENIRQIILKQIYKYESKNIPDIDINQYYKNRNKNKSIALRKRFKKELYVYNVDGKLLHIFNNVIEASEKLNISVVNIENSIFRKHQHKGLLFSHTKITFSKYIPNWNTRKIYIFDYNFNQINNFKSMLECAKFYNLKVNTINSNCNRLNLNTIVNLYFVRDNMLDKFIKKYNIENFNN